MEPEEWTAAFAERLGERPPDPEEVEAILKLAGVAAHASQRTAAPVATWLAGRTGRPVSELLTIAEEIGGSGEG